MRTFIAGAFAACCLMGVAQAETPASEGAWLTLKAPTTADHLIQDGALWRCKTDVCRSPKVKSLPSVRACRKVVGQLGAVSAFNYRGEALSEADLAACNTAAKPA
jgi:hypothetical protein